MASEYNRKREYFDGSRVAPAQYTVNMGPYSSTSPGIGGYLQCGKNDPCSPTKMGRVQL